MREPAADLLLPIPTVGRVFAVDRIVRFGDLDPAGRARLDAYAHYVQDIAGDDTAASGLPDESAWVVRRSVFEVRQAPTFREELHLRTFCSGLGSRWAERRVAMDGRRGADVQAVSLWVRIDPADGRPRALTEAFREIYGPSTGGRSVSSRLAHDTAVPSNATRTAWPLRFVDLDPLGHVNNAASWAVLAGVVDDAQLVPPFRAELEYRDPIERGADVEVAVVRDDAGVRVWVYDRRSSANYLTGFVAMLPG